MDPTQPIGKIKSQVLFDTPITSDNTLVDDLVALVDDAVALSSGQSTQIPVLRVSTSPNAPKVHVRQRY